MPAWQTATVNNIMNIIYKDQLLINLLEEANPDRGKQQKGIEQFLAIFLDSEECAGECTKCAQYNIKLIRRAWRPWRPPSILYYLYVIIIIIL